jgi:hypothetical protein
LHYIQEGKPRQPPPFLLKKNGGSYLDDMDTWTGTEECWLALEQLCQDIASENIQESPTEQYIGKPNWVVSITTWGQ